MDHTHSASPVPALLDTLLPDSPMLVRTRQLLPALDWRQARTDQVAELISRIAAAGGRVPRWLAQDLLAGGHTVPDEALAADAQALKPLSVLNGADCTREAAASIARELEAQGGLGAWPVDAASQCVSRLAAVGETAAAARLALLAHASAPEVLRAVKPHLNDYINSLPALRVRICGTSSTQAFAGALRYAFAAGGLRAEITEADYGAWMAELMRPPGPADLLVLLLDQHHFMPQDWRKGAQLIAQDLEERLAAFSESVKSYCARTGTAAVATTLPAAALPSAGYDDRNHPAGAARVCARVNSALSEIAAGAPLFSFLDSDQALAVLPPQARFDPKLWFYGRFAYSEAATRHLASGIGRLWRARTQGPAKVLALDFDNTLWGGIYGDDGIANLACGDDFPGSAYKAFQQECLRLKAQGMILVALSKNNADALDVFSTHPGVLLERGDFVATAVNWETKPDNIRKIAAELRLGLDSFVFLDDSPHERAAMRRLCPQVQVPEMPSDPAARPDWLRALSCTWPLRITAEDSKRSDYYAADLKTRELRASSADYESYLESLGQRLTVTPLSKTTLPRAAQLHQRTNQFNLTNARFSEGELAAYCGQDPAHLAFTGSVSDRFGEYGLVVAAAIECREEKVRILSFVMSCRVIGRGVEHAFLAAMLDTLRMRGVSVVQGLFKPSAKNAIASKLYMESGFAAAGTLEDCETWELALREPAGIPTSPAIHVLWSETPC